MNINEDVLENIIIESWKSTLGVEHLDKNSNFFGLGGDSMMVTIMVMQIEEKIGGIIMPEIVFDKPQLDEFILEIKNEYLKFNNNASQ